MDWDKFKMAQRFLQRANAIHPEEIENTDARVDALARQDLFYDCYMSSFSKEQLMKRLDEVIDGGIEIPDEEGLDEERYRNIYIEEARLMQRSIRSGTMD